MNLWSVVQNPRDWEPVTARSYDVTPDDERFITIRQADDVGEAARLILVQNFFEELKGSGA